MDSYFSCFPDVIFGSPFSLMKAWKIRTAFWIITAVLFGATKQLSDYWYEPFAAFDKLSVI